MHAFGQIELHLACHRDLTPGTVERLCQGFEQLRRNGEFGFGLH